MNSSVRAKAGEATRLGAAAVDLGEQLDEVDVKYALDGLHYDAYTKAKDLVKQSN